VLSVMFSLELIVRRDHPQIVPQRGQTELANKRTGRMTVRTLRPTTDTQTDNLSALGVELPT
jgi:hypothetical protein